MKDKLKTEKVREKLMSDKKSQNVVLKGSWKSSSRQRWRTASRSEQITKDKIIWNTEWMEVMRR
jgi:hypothetical protein